MCPSNELSTYPWPGLASCSVSSFVIAFISALLPNTLISGGSVFFIVFLLAFPASIITYVVWVVPVHKYISKKIKIKFTHLLVITCAPSVFIFIASKLFPIYNIRGLPHQSTNSQAIIVYSVISMLLGICASFVFFKTHPYHRAT